MPGGFASGAAGETFEDCLVREIMAGDGQRSAGSIRSLCEDDEDNDNPAEYRYRYLGYGDIRTVWALNRLSTAQTTT